MDAHPNRLEDVMSGKQGSSPKTDRAKRTENAKKGAVRKHGPKRFTPTANTGLLDDLHSRSVQATRVVNVEENVRAATNLLYNELGKRTVAICNRDNWQPSVWPLLRDYIKSLVYGDGSKPETLGSEYATEINNLFVELCFRRIVGDDVLPGQRQDWYLPALTEYREARRCTSQPMQLRRPSPLDIAPRRPAEKLQPTG